MMRTESEMNLLQAIFNEMQLIKKSVRLEEDRLMKTSDVMQMVGMTRATILSMIDSNQFPAPDWVSESGYKHWWKSTIYAHFNKKTALAS